MIKIDNFYNLEGWVYGRYFYNIDFTDKDILEHIKLKSVSFSRCFFFDCRFPDKMYFSIKAYLFYNCVFDLKCKIVKQSIPKYHSVFLSYITCENRCPLTLNKQILLYGENNRIIRKNIQRTVKYYLNNGYTII